MAQGLELPSQMQNVTTMVVGAAVAHCSQSMKLTYTGPRYHWDGSLCQGFSSVDQKVQNLAFHSILRHTATGWEMKQFIWNLKSTWKCRWSA